MKIATHGIANKLNRMMSTIACLECHRSETETCFTCDCERGRFCHDIGAGYAIETCNPLGLCGASAASHEVGARNAIESFSTKQALEVLRGPLVTILARYMGLKIDIFSTIFFLALLVTLLAGWHEIELKKLSIAFLAPIS